MKATRTTVTRRTFIAGSLAAGAALGLRNIAAAASMSSALFVAAHPDDETLAMGVAVAEHVAAGQDVHVLFLTDGHTSGARGAINGDWVSGWWRVRHNPAAEGYAPLDAATFGQARIREGNAALRVLAAGLTGMVTVHEAGLQPDAITAALAVESIRQLCDRIAPGGPVRIKTHSHIVDNHPDHIAAGKAARQLAASYPTRFGNVRHYILPAYWADARLSTVSEVWDMPTDAGIRDRVVNACRAYGAWAPPHSYAIGYHSTSGLFARIVAGPRCLFHT